MDWSFPSEAEEFRKEVKAFISEHLTAVSYTHLTLPTIYSV